ncbi:hypothetical protein CBR_g17575 [Chara braunii]|uniref:Uncharacterized protein n=1 Tax=Chara braunii TaxID=69332 RepID=A0A388KUX2_CHABU|nr:hypothetical protein CBR_g17575 [Chara braunii]|eukprot:GBG73864.1 hypothetical protein CBR_g17575 [Chara braunii]
MGAPYEELVCTKLNVEPKEPRSAAEEEEEREGGEEAVRMLLPKEKMTDEGKKISDDEETDVEETKLLALALASSLRSATSSPAKDVSNGDSPAAASTIGACYWHALRSRCKRWDKAGIALVVSSVILVTIFGLPWMFPWITDFGREAVVTGFNHFSPDVPCDYTKGSWLFDDSLPLYSACNNLAKHNCELDGRPDLGYQKWRWQPFDCRIDRFSARRFVAAMRRVQRRRLRRSNAGKAGKAGEAGGAEGRGDEYATLAFVGDSLGQNMFLSMKCILEAQLGTPTRNFAKPRYATVEWKPHLLRLVLIKSPYLTSLQVKGTDKEITGDFTRESVSENDPWWELHLDKIPAGWVNRLTEFDVIVFNSGHWWVTSKLDARKIEFAEGSVLGENITLIEAFQHAISTVMNHMVDLVQSGDFDGEVYLRSYSPHHFTKGDWNTGGRCDAKLPIFNESQVALHRHNSMKQMASYNEAFVSVFNATKARCAKCRFHYLQITELSDYRPDAHPSNYTGRAGNVEDCSHWCLPGLPDTWNELLLFTLEKPCPENPWWYGRRGGRRRRRVGSVRTSGLPDTWNEARLFNLETDHGCVLNAWVGEHEEQARWKCPVLRQSDTWKSRCRAACAKARGAPLLFSTLEKPSLFASRKIRGGFVDSSHLRTCPTRRASSCNIRSHSR